MGIASLVKALVYSLLVAPFVAIIFWGVGVTLKVFFEAVKIEGGGKLAQTQDSVRGSTWLAFDLLYSLSSLEVILLALALVFVLIIALRSRANSY